MRKRISALLLCVLLALQISAPPARAAEPVYFVAAGNEVQPVSDRTMPFWSGGYLYIPAAIFTGNVWRALDVRYNFLESEQIAILDRGGDQVLLFDMKGSNTVDSKGTVSYPGGLLRNGVPYVPASLVAKYFNLVYSVTEVEHGYLVWIRQQGFGLTDREFADAASYSLSSRYANYIKGREQQTVPSVPETPEGAEIEGKSIYLCLTAGEDAAAMLDALDRYEAQAAFFCTPAFLETQGDLLRRMTATGQTIAILADAGDEERTVAEQLERGNRALARATCGKTRLAYIQNGGGEARLAALEAGYRCLEPELDRSGYELRTSFNAASLLQRASDYRGDVTIWLEETANPVGLRAFLAAAENADGRCLAWTETT